MTDADEKFVVIAQSVDQQVLRIGNQLWIVERMTGGLVIGVICTSMIAVFSGACAWSSLFPSAPTSESPMRAVVGIAFVAVFGGLSAWMWRRRSWMMNAPPSEQLAGFVIDPDRRVLEDRRSKRTIPLHEARLVRRNVSLFQADVAVLELRSGSEKVCQVVQVDAASGTSVIEKVVAAFKGAGVA